MNFKYTVNLDGTVTYIADVDGKKQNLSGRDISSKEALENDLAEYTMAYESGLEIEKVVAGSDIVIGKQVSATVEA